MVYAIEKEEVRHDDYSEEVDDVGQHLSKNYSKINLYNWWVSTKEITLDFKY